MVFEGVFNELSIEQAVALLSSFNYIFYIFTWILIYTYMFK
jgi:hypothetical protein